MTGTVLVDTNVFTARLRERSPLATRYAKHLFGLRIALAPQTVAEARYGALNANWGPARQQRLARLVARARILPVDIDTIEAVAELRNQCRMIGHPLHQSNHNADLWIAATTQQRHPHLDRHLERRTQTLRLDQDSRPNPQLHHPLLQTN